MKHLQGKMVVCKNDKLQEGIYRMILKGEAVKQIKKPGQFINLKLSNYHEPYLRRPMSICDYDDQTVTIIYRVVGQGSKLLSKSQPGDQYDCLIGLGNGFEVKEGKKALLIGGGLGTPPLYRLAKDLIKKGIEVEIVLGFKDINDAFCQEEFSKLGKTYIATMDGSLGDKGTVIDVIEKYNLEYDHYYTCGPEPMLQALASKLPDNGQLSFESRMGCGFGACMGCSFPTKNGYKRVCVEGPIFTSEELITNG